LDSQRARIADYSAPNDLSTSLADAGFELRALNGADGQRTVLLPNGGSVTMKIAVASPTRR